LAGLSVGSKISTPSCLSLPISQPHHSRRRRMTKTWPLASSVPLSDVEHLERA
jgi:hypothetical protein